jgi:hypothetical protein
MKRFDLNNDFSADCTIAEKSRSGRIYRVKVRNAAGGKMLIPVALYFAWRRDVIEAYNPHWRVDCFVNHHPLAPSKPITLGQALIVALRREGLCDDPIWLSSHRSDDETGEAFGNVFEDEAFEDE